MKLVAPLLGVAVLVAAGCGGESRTEQLAARRPAPEGTIVEIRESTFTPVMRIAGLAEPVRQATISTRVMGAVVAVAVNAGDRVRAGELLVRIDARELDARQRQVEAGLAEAEAVLGEAQVTAARFRGLYADSAAAKAQLDAAEAGLARAQAGVASANAARGELDAMRAYAELRAPFTGLVTRRWVDPGAFVAPGAPIITMEDPSAIRIRVTAAPGLVRGIQPGDTLEGQLEDTPVRTVLESVYPAPGALTTYQARLNRPSTDLPSNGAAYLDLPLPSRQGILVPRKALVQEGDLTGVELVTQEGLVRRWVRVGVVTGDRVEILAGLRAGDRVLVPAGREGER